MNTLVHGIELDAEGKPAWLRFGILKLLDYLLCTNADSSAPEWVSRFQAPVFAHRREHFRQCFWKFDRAAGHVTRCENASTPWMDSSLQRANQAIDRAQRGETPETSGGQQTFEATPDLLAYFDANADLPLYFDLMLFYLRI